MDWTFFCLIIISGVLVFFGILIFRNTIIPLGPLFIGTSFVSILFSLGLWIFLRNNLSTISILFSGFVIGGGLFYFSFLYINKIFPLSTSKSFTYKVQEKGSLAKGSRGNCNNPYVVIYINGIEKQLIFTCDLKNKSENSQKVVLEIYDGFFGYPFISKKELI
ncbi:hypothetical protein [Algoriphagus halophilus]|uniref:hypothetical protein n=1 Tax=Algoriphagus halophilus TaxID=226505 RepID=UPI0011615004|nr:hypothetical protein [Algoriphagus halophilus]